MPLVYTEFAMGAEKLNRTGRHRPRTLGLGGLVTGVFASALAWTALLVAAAAQPKTVDQVAATVNGDVITLSDVQWLIQYRRIPLPGDEQARQRLYRQTLQQLIEQKLIASESVQTPGIQILDEEINRRIAAYRMQFPSEQAFQENLAAMEMSMDDLRELVRRQLAVLKFVKLRFEPFIIALPDEIREYYESQVLPEFEQGGGEAPPLSTLEEEIRQILTLQKTNDEVDNWVRGAIAKAKVEVLLLREPSTLPNVPPEFADQIQIAPLRPPD